MHTLTTPNITTITGSDVIALIDFDASLNHRLAERLRAAGCTVHQASEPEAISRVLNERPGIVIVDPLTTDASFNIFEYLYDDEAAGVIVFSGNMKLAEREKLFQYGILEYFSKEEPAESVADEILRLLETVRGNAIYHVTMVSPCAVAQEAFKKMVSKRNYRSCYLKHLDEAKEKWSRQDHELPDLLIVDVGADGPMEGVFELVRYLRIQRLSELPIILLFQTSRPNLFSKLYRMGVNTILCAPYSSEKFLSKVTRNLDFQINKTRIRHEHNLSQQLKMMIDSSSIVSKADPRGNITYVNDQFCRISGYSRDELIGRPHNIIRHPDNSRELFQQMWNTIQSKNIYHGIIMNRRKDGSTYYVDSTIAPVLDDNDTIIEYISIRHDVSPLIEKQHEIEDKRRKIQDVLDAQTSLICMVDKIEGIRQSNRGFLNFLGIESLSPEVNKFNYLHELFLDIDEALHIKHGERYVWLDRLYEMRGRFVKVAMKDRHFNHHIFAIHVEKIPDPTYSEGVCYLVSFENVTELNRALREAKEASEAESRFLATMSHEIRTPLNGILGFAELLQETKLSDEQQKYLQAIEYSGDTLRQIINDILEVMKLDRETLELNDEPINLIGELEAIIYPFYAQAKKKEVDLLVYIDPKLPLTVEADLLRIKQSMINLLGNAVKFTPAGKQIHVRIKKLSAADGKVKIGFTIADEGIGVRDEHKDRIFKAFVQADNSIAREYGGTGLGLNIVSRIIAAKGGKLSFKSRYGHGSVFHTELIFRSELENHPYQYRNELVCFYLPSTPPSGRFLLVERYIKQFHCCPQCIILRSHELESIEDREDASVFLFLDHMGMAEVSVITKKYRKTKFYVVPSFSDHLPHMKLIAKNVFWIHSELTRSNLSHILQIYEKPIAIPHSYQPLSYFQKLKVLVAEDNEVNQFYIEELLKKLGIECDLAHDGYEAVKKFINGRFDLVLMDINMPNLDGITATQQILRYEKQTGSHHVPIIGLSADAVTKNITSYIAQGLDGYLIKPLRKSDLVKMLEELFASRITEFEPPSVPAKEQNMQNTLSFAETMANTLELPIEVIYELFRRYINNAELLMQQLEEDPEISELKHIIHSLKGISRNLYLEPLGTLCEQVERDIPSMEGESKRLRLEELIFEIRRTIGQMRQELNE